MRLRKIKTFVIGKKNNHESVVLLESSKDIDYEKFLDENKNLLSKYEEIIFSKFEYIEGDN